MILDKKSALKSVTNWGIALATVAPVSLIDPGVSQAVTQIATLVAPTISADPQALSQTALAFVSLLGVLVSLWGRWRIGDLYLMKKPEN